MRYGKIRKYGRHPSFFEICACMFGTIVGLMLAFAVLACLATGVVWLVRLVSPVWIG